jgi:L-alanine-DL-glutamate epimerase-like enolase superfamily enzyme
LFAENPQATLRKAREVARAGFRAAKFGWGPYGRGTVQQDADQAHAAREGLGPDCQLLVDAGTVWGDDVSLAERRLPVLRECNVTWLEEPFVSGALNAYQRLAGKTGPLKLAGGEGCHNLEQARNMIDYAGLGYVQIDAGRIGGITIAKSVADYAASKGVQFVNHTFTTHLALSASVQPYAGLESHGFCEFPSEPSALARDFTKTCLVPNGNGCITLPDKPGLGLEPNLEHLKKFEVDVEIKVNGRVIFENARLP